MSPPPQMGVGSSATLSVRGIWLLAIASAIVTANAYYIHPIIGRVAESFAVSNALVGAVPALNQIALALGVLLLLPLGDRVNNRRLIVGCLSVQLAALITMALARDFPLFLAASTLLGFFTITPYLLPAYTSKRVEPGRLGFVTAVLTTGVVAGVQLSRLGSGVIAEHYGWRAVYWIAAVLMGLAACLLPLLMREEPQPATRVGEPKTSGYLTLIVSLPRLAVAYPSVVVSGLIQGMSFAIFLATWLGISLHLTSAELGLGTDTVGYLAAFSAIGLLTTPRLGRLADHLGAERARLLMAFLQLAAVLSLALAAANWRMLLLPIILTSVAGPLIDITGRMSSLSQAPQLRTRLMSIYITLMFLGGGLGSWAGTLAYDLGGWTGTVTLTCSLSLAVCALSALAWRRQQTRIEAS